MILFLLVVTATFRPLAPTVGDPIAIEFQGPAVLDPSPHYEIVNVGTGFSPSQSGLKPAPTSTFVIRSFEPKPFALAGRVGDVRFRNLVVPMKSVLKPGDALEPAPLKPPLSKEPSKIPIIAIAIAGVLAALFWAAVVFLARRLRPPAAEPALPPVDQFRAAVQALLAANGDGRWAGLADAVREYVAAMDFELGEELTTSEILRVLSAPPRAAAPHGIVAEVLRLGDLEKFSPWGAPFVDFATVADRALTIPEYFEPPPPAEEEVAA